MVDTIHEPYLRHPSKKRQGKSELGYKFISLFEKMPGNVYCPRFYILHHAVGCPFRCSYCFLQNTLRGNTSPRWYDNLDTMVAEVSDWLTKTEKPSLLNTGELADSYAVSTEYIKRVLPLFLAQKKHVISFLTKSAVIPKELLEDPRITQPGAPIRLGWSINADEVARRFEPLAAPPHARIAIARMAKQMGYHVRIRIDPIIPVLGWGQMYDKLIEDVATIKPDFVTIRTLRAQSNLQSWVKRCHAANQENPFEAVIGTGPGDTDETTIRDIMVRDGDDKALRIDPVHRLQIYRRLGAALDAKKIPWGLCKETTQVLEQLGKLNHMCNCLP
jgi:DNA repair photolyase